MRAPLGDDATSGYPFKPLYVSPRTSSFGVDCIPICPKSKAAQSLEIGLPLLGGAQRVRIETNPVRKGPRGSTTGKIDRP